MSILDLDDSLDLNLYYTNKIIEFFKSNGVNGWGFAYPNDVVINTSYLFKHYQLSNVLESPEKYALYTVSVGEVHCLQILDAGERFNKEWYRVQVKQTYEFGRTKLLDNDMNIVLNFQFINCKL